ncbi:CRE_HP_G0096950.mRNA.1.CDS.1 [Saccharomyces cerevisiae]|nr:CNB_1a_G0014870.mRNA.1.CDS.1 [Saccharomyces cerevisiae]CAI4431030.1 CCT_1a_G0014930.mRNA.1.CDS.1 [Saccharomyces cerevisiae]CAI4914882.1 CGH_1_HP_G0012920.mRNA.1.CDS.1 [Saccharomyces cerevisiae]CAI4964760.1 CRE_HP_G0046840.mRNA.1.CDS.1 [Saccharomyces cerevisiae]CAI5026187.1 CRE_HP_G0096950.mRNA.1.CDS.1 [Saccharomyces cerevisiae]
MYYFSRVAARAFCCCIFFCLATAYSRPDRNPRKIEKKDKKFFGASKNTNPANAMGNLFKAPTIEYVVEEVTRTHQPEQYDIPTDMSPLMTIAASESADKFTDKFFVDQSSIMKEKTSSKGNARTLL